MSDLALFRASDLPESEEAHGGAARVRSLLGPTLRPAALLRRLRQVGVSGETAVAIGTHRSFARASSAETVRGMLLRTRLLLGMHKIASLRRSLTGGVADAVDGRVRAAEFRGYSRGARCWLSALS